MTKDLKPPLAQNAQRMIFSPETALAYARPGQPPAWAEALDSFLNLQNSPQTRRAYRAAIVEAMTALEMTRKLDGNIAA